MTLNGWHHGERLIHEKLGHSDNYSIMTLYHSISGELPEQHAEFYSTRLPFLPIVTLDASGRPWGSILAAKDDKPGFVRNSRYNTLSIDATLWPGDPLLKNAKEYTESGTMLVAGIGVEFSTRRRNKFAGKVAKLEKTDDDIHLDLVVNEALGNCPKYITLRDLVPQLDRSPTIIHEKLNLTPDERLPDDVVKFILGSDTVFLGTTYTAPAKESSRFPSHLGMNQRGGRKGFIRVIPSDGRTVVLPDFSGNRFMTSLGNIEANPMASMTFVSFETGAILYITGIATNLLGAAAQRIMPLHIQNALTTVHVSGFTLVADALPIRQRPGSNPTPSPYSPPVRLLAEEDVQAGGKMIEGATALLTKIVLHSPTLATFSWAPSERLTIVPGQAAILDFTSLLGARAYQHMAASNPMSVNDDRIRTWTVSSTSEDGGFSLTMREKPGGVVTGALFNIARKLQEAKPALLEDARQLSISVRLVGITGDFVLPPPPSIKLLWLAGGIGLTPFLAMLRGLTPAHEYNIRLVLSTREPEVLVPLIRNALGAREGDTGIISIDIFSEKDVPDLGVEGVALRRYRGRITKEVFATSGGEAGVREDDVIRRNVFLCGPEAFENAALDALVELGVDKGTIKREAYVY